ncbi:MAG: hypothetical protein ABIN89_09755 [Chitinophagaceae bacterium]
MNFKFLGFLISCCSMSGVFGQDVNGIWRGELTQNPGGCYSKYFIELQMQIGANQVEGVTYIYYDTTRYVKLNFNGLLNKQTKGMILSENKVLEYKIPSNCIPCIKTYDLTWSKKNNEEQLIGTWKGSEMGLMNACPPGTIYLKRVVSSSFKRGEIIQNEQLATIQKSLVPASRKVELIQTIDLETASVKVELYDNGQIDGDTISVFLNDQLILYKKGLSDKPITLDIPIQESKDYKMIMYAENLGSIPPNTALMVVTSGKKKYEIYLSSSEQKSAAVKFRYEK